MSCLDKTIDFQVEASSNQEDVEVIEVASDDEDVEMDAEDGVDLYEDLSIVMLANNHADVLDYCEELSEVEELSDLSGDEFSEAYSTKAQPAAPEEDMSDSNMSDIYEDSLLNDPAERTLQPGNELEFDEEEIMLPLTEEELLREMEDYGDPMFETSPLFESSRPSSPVLKSAATPTTSPEPSVDNDVQLAGANKQPVQGCDPAVLYRTDDDLKEIVKKLPHRPLEATMNRWKLRTASPSMKEYIRRIRRDIDADGPSKFFLPWNLRDSLMVKKERLIAQGPYVNRKFIIDSYRLKKIQEQWKIDSEQSKRSKMN